MRIPYAALRQRMTVEDYQGEGAYGASFGDPREDLHASIQQTQAIVVNWKDEQITVDTMVLIRPEDGPVAAGSRVTINGKTYQVVKAFPIPDEFRPSHYELMVNLWSVE